MIVHIETHISGQSQGISMGIIAKEIINIFACKMRVRGQTTFGGGASVIAKIESSVRGRDGVFLFYDSNL